MMPGAQDRQCSFGVMLAREAEFRAHRGERERAPRESNSYGLLERRCTARSLRRASLQRVCLAGLKLSLSIEKQSYRAVVHKFHLHHCLKAAAFYVCPVLAK